MIYYIYPLWYLNLSSSTATQVFGRDAPARGIQLRPSWLNADAAAQLLGISWIILINYGISWYIIMVVYTKFWYIMVYSMERVVKSSSKETLLTAAKGHVGLVFPPRPGLDVLHGSIRSSERQIMAKRARVGR